MAPDVFPRTGAFLEGCGTEDVPNLAELLSFLSPSCKTQSPWELWILGARRGQTGHSTWVFAPILPISNFEIAHGCFYLGWS